MVKAIRNIKLHPGQKVRASFSVGANLLESVRRYGALRDMRQDEIIEDAIRSLMLKTRDIIVVMPLHLSMDLTGKCNSVAQALGYPSGISWVEQSVKQAINETWETMHNMVPPGEDKDERGQDQTQEDSTDHRGQGSR